MIKPSIISLLLLIGFEEVDILVIFFYHLDLEFLVVVRLISRVAAMVVLTGSSPVL